MDTDPRHDGRPHAPTVPLALTFASVGFASLAPTTAHLDADQHELDTAGCGRSLVLALRFGGTKPT